MKLRIPWEGKYVILKRPYEINNLLNKIKEIKNKERK